MIFLEFFHSLFQHFVKVGPGGYLVIQIEQEFGDTLFALINYARFIDVNPETALERTNKKFINRFQFIEEKALLQGRSLKDMTLEEMDKIWNEAKTQE